MEDKNNLIKNKFHTFDVFLFESTWGGNMRRAGGVSVLAARKLEVVIELGGLVWFLNILGLDESSFCVELPFFLWID